jgi:hypothetical protein
MNRFQIDPAIIKKHKIIHQNDTWVWEDVASIPNNSGGLYWIYSDISKERLLQLPERTAWRYRRTGANPDIEESPEWEGDKLGANCLKTRASNTKTIDSLLLKPAHEGGLYCVYNGYATDKLRQRAKEHLGPSDPGVGCLHLVDSFLYHKRLTGNQWEFWFCRYEDLPGADLTASKKDRKRFLSVWEQALRFEGWPILCSA